MMSLPSYPVHILEQRLHERTRKMKAAPENHGQEYVGRSVMPCHATPTIPGSGVLVSYV